MRSPFTADQAGQSAVGLGTEPCLGPLTRCLLSLNFTLWNLLSVIPTGTTSLPSFFSEAFLLLLLLLFFCCDETPPKPYILSHEEMSS